MIQLDGNTHTLQCVMSGAAATTNPDYYVCWANLRGAELVTGGDDDGTLNGTTAVNLLAGVEEHQFIVKYLSVHNRDTAQVTLTFKMDVSGTARFLHKCVLQTGETLHYDEAGWYVTNASGYVLTGNGASVIDSIADADVTNAPSRNAVFDALALKVPTTTTVNGHALSANVTVSASDVGLGSVTNDAQTKAAIVPNTAPSAGQILVGNAGGTAYAKVSASGDATLASTGAVTIANDAVTYAKMQNVSATDKLLGRSTAGAGDVEEIACTAAGRALIDDANAAAQRDTLKISQRTRFRFETECTQGNATGLNITGAASGTAASVSVIANASANEFGVVRFLSGTTTTGRCNITGAITAQPIFLGIGVAYIYARLAVATLSDGTNTFAERWGFPDSVTGESTNGVFFRYTHSVNGGRWEAVCRAAGVETAVDTGITAVAATFNKFEITVNAAATSVVFAIDGATVATITTNIPSGYANGVNYGGMALKSAGSTTTAMADVDSVEGYVEYTTPR